MQDDDKSTLDGSSVFSMDLVMSIRRLQLYTIAPVRLLMLIVFSSRIFAIRDWLIIHQELSPSFRNFKTLIPFLLFR